MYKVWHGLEVVYSDVLEAEKSPEILMRAAWQVWVHNRVQTPDVSEIWFCIKIILSTTRYYNESLYIYYPLPSIGVNLNMLIWIKDLTTIALKTTGDVRVTLSILIQVWQI